MIYIQVNISEISLIRSHHFLVHLPNAKNENSQEWLRKWLQFSTLNWTTISRVQLNYHFIEIHFELIPLNILESALNMQIQFINNISSNKAKECGNELHRQFRSKMRWAMFWINFNAFRWGQTCIMLSKMFFGDSKQNLIRISVLKNDTGKILSKFITKDS